jgi:excisionase family DNA binding protein
MLSSNTPNAVPTFYDAQAVAGMFQMSRMTVYRAIRSGELPAVRIRGRWLVPARVIDALVTAAEAAVHPRPASDWPRDVSPHPRHGERPQESPSAKICGAPDPSELPGIARGFRRALPVLAMPPHECEESRQIVAQLDESGSVQQPGGEING